MRIALAVGLLALAAPAPRPTDSEAPAILLRGGTVYASPDDPPLENGAVALSGGKIVAVGSVAKVSVPAGAKVIDCRGLAIAPGFWNAHVHFTEPKWAEAGQRPAAILEEQLREMLLRWGFTTAVDIGSALPNTLALRRRIDSGEVAGPRILTAGVPLYPPNGVPYYLLDALPPEVVEQLPQPATSAEAARIVEEELGAGADLTKLFTGSWVARGRVLPMPVPVAAGAVAAAHRLGKPVFSHASNLAGAQVAVDARVDVIAHAMEDTRGVDDALLRRMIDRRIALIPTLALFGRNENVADIRAQVARYLKLGGQVLFGTDVGFLTEYDTAPEIAQLRAAGLSDRDILRMLTTSPSNRFGVSRRTGRVAPGLEADVVVLAGGDRLDFSNVRTTIRAGHIVYVAR